MIWIATMFLDDWDMLQCQMEALAGTEAFYVIAEAPVTHRGEPKPLHLQENPRRLAGLAKPGVHIMPVVASPLPPGDSDHWGREHAQRHAAWVMGIMRGGCPADTDVVLICDGDEIPSRELLEFLPEWAAHPDSAALAVNMKTALFAVDWLASAPLPPTCVAVTMGYLCKRVAGGHGLGQVRDGRNSYPRFSGHGGWHLSWLGGVGRQREKLFRTTCHTELLSSEEGRLIASGERWRTDQDGGGIPVAAVDVDSTWPSFVYERRCPQNWFRPRPEDRA